MSDRRFTLFELHTHGHVQLGPGSLPGLGDRETEYQDVEIEEEAEEEGGSKAPALLLALLVLGGAVLAYRRFSGDDVDEVETVELAESDDVAATAD